MTDAMGFAATVMGPGVQLFVKPTRKFKRVTLAVFVEQELSHELASPTALLPRVLKRGTRTYPETLDLEHAQAQLYGADLSAGVLKIGERHVMTFTLTLPAAKYVDSSGHYERALQLLAETVKYPALQDGLLRPDYVDQERQQLIRQIRRLPDNKPSYARWRCVQEMCRNEAYGVYSLGEIQSLERQTRESLTRYHQELLERNPISVYAYGDFDPDQMVGLFQEHLSFDRSAGPVELPPTAVDVPAPPQPRYVDEAQEMSQAWLILGYRSGISRQDDDYFPALVFNDLFGGSPYSRLFLHVREKASMAYSAGSSFDNNKGLLFAAAGIDPARRHEAQQLIGEHLADLAAGNVHQDELDAAKASVITQFMEREDEASRMILAHLSGRIGGRITAVQDAVAAIKKVTAVEVAAVARRMVLDTVYFLHPAQK